MQHKRVAIFEEKELTRERIDQKLKIMVIYIEINNCRRVMEKSHIHWIKLGKIKPSFSTHRVIFFCALAKDHIFNR